MENENGDFYAIIIDAIVKYSLMFMFSFLVELHQSMNCNAIAIKTVIRSQSFSTKMPYNGRIYI